MELKDSIATYTKETFFHKTCIGPIIKSAGKYSITVNEYLLSCLSQAASKILDSDFCIGYPVSSRKIKDNKRETKTLDLSLNHARIKFKKNQDFSYNEIIKHLRIETQISQEYSKPDILLSNMGIIDSQLEGFPKNIHSVWYYRDITFLNLSIEKQMYPSIVCYTYRGNMYLSLYIPRNSHLYLKIKPLFESFVINIER